MVGVPGARTVPFVVPKEDVLEARLNACQRNYRKARRRLDHSLRRPLHRETHTMPVVQCLYLDHAVQSFERLCGNRVGERDRHLVTLDGLHFGYVPDAHQAPVADDADPGAGLLDFAQHVRRQKDGASFIARLEDQAIEFLLVQWIEAAGWLVENQQAWAVHEGLDQDDLALVSGRALAELAPGVSPAPPPPPLYVPLIVAPPH